MRLPRRLVPATRTVVLTPPSLCGADFSVDPPPGRLADTHLRHSLVSCVFAGEERHRRSVVTAWI